MGTTFVKMKCSELVLKDATTLVIRSGERSDSGIYRMTITVGDQVVEHDFDVAVIDYPRTGSRYFNFH